MSISQFDTNVPKESIALQKSLQPTYFTIKKSHIYNGSKYNILMTYSNTTSRELLRIDIYNHHNNCNCVNNLTVYTNNNNEYEWGKNNWNNLFDSNYKLMDIFNIFENINMVPTACTSNKEYIHTFDFDHDNNLLMSVYKNPNNEIVRMDEFYEYNNVNDIISDKQNLIFRIALFKLTK